MIGTALASDGPAGPMNTNRQSSKTQADGPRPSTFACSEPPAARCVPARGAGQVKVNGGAFTPVAPFGGYKKPGIGRELGKQGRHEYFETLGRERLRGTDVP